MARRKKNPTTLETVLWASGAGFVGILAGYGLSAMVLRRRGEHLGLEAKEWSWWVDEVSGLIKPGGGLLGPIEVYYRPTIQSPAGERIQLTPKQTREAAEKAAKEAIAERGGVAVEGKPIG